MRNIKSAAMLSAAAIGLLYMTACSSDVNEPGISLTPAETGEFTIVNPDQSRIHNFGNETRTAIDDVNKVLSEVTPDENGSELPEDGVLTNNTVYTVKADVSTTLTLPEGANATVHVLEGAHLTLTGVPAGLTIYNWGGIKLKDGAEVNGKIVSNNNVRVVNATINSEVKAKGVLDNSDSDLTINGTVVANAITNSKKVDISKNAAVSTGYLKCNTVNLYGTVTLDQNGLFDAQTFYVFADAHVNVEATATNAAVVVRKDFVADDIETPKYVFAPEIGLAFNNSKVGNTDVEFNQFDWQVCSSNRVVYVPRVEGCHPEFIAKNLDGAPTGKTITEIKKVAEVAAPEGLGEVSATCLAVDGNKVYASYHTFDKGVNGYIESLNNDNGKISFVENGAFETALYDFNHLMIDNNNNKIVAVGSWKKEGVDKKEGGIIATIDKGFTSSSELKHNWLKSNKEVMVTETSKNGNSKEVRGDYMNAGDGNCVVRVKDKYIVAASHGYVAVNVSDLTSEVETFHAVSTDGTFKTGNNGKGIASSKHIAVKDNNISILSHDENGNAFIETYTSEALANGNKTELHAVIAPLEGKNVLAYNGNDLYACLGDAGIYKNYTKAKEFKGSQDNIPVNAVDFDENYIYACVGSFLYVLDKNDMTEVCHYYANDKKSANYVKVVNGKIYVAYGKNGVQVFELSTKTF